MTERPEKKKRRILPTGIKRRWLLNSISVVIVFVMLVSVSTGLVLTEYYYSAMRIYLENRAEQTAKYINRYLSGSYDEFYYYANQIVTDFGDKDRLEMQVIDSYGRVMFSSTGLTAGFIPATSDVMDCLQQKQPVTFTGYDLLTDERVMAVSVPVMGQDQVIGLIRLVSSLRNLDRQVLSVYLTLALICVVLITGIAISNQFFVRSIVNPVIHINELAKKIGSGQYGARLDMEFDDEIGELLTTINNMSTEISRVEKIKNDFISSVSHELRTPLTAIGGWAETIASEGADRQLVGSGLDIIQKETLRLSQIVEELLDFSRIESGGFKLQSEVFDIRGELYDAVFTYTEMLRREGIAANYDEPHEPILIRGDKNRIKQVFLNLIDNAAKYGKDGGRIDLNVAVDGQDAVIVVRDYGAGIPADELPFVKEKFFKGSSRVRGTGIGLAVCDEIVSLHAGTLDIESEYGEGTTVTIRLPLHDA